MKILFPVKSVFVSVAVSSEENSHQTINCDANEQGKHTCLQAFVGNLLGADRGFLLRVFLGEIVLS